MVGALMCLISISAAEAGREITFHRTIEEARGGEEAAASERRPLVVTFHAAWCAWCRKMEVDTLRDEEVTALANKFLWVRVDVDEHPDLAARFDVAGLPDTFVLDGQDQVIASQPGYMAPDVFASFLREALENPQPRRALLPDLLARLSKEETESERRETLARIVRHLSGPDRRGRAELLEALTKAGPELRPMLLELMSDERLAVRAAAGGALARATRAGLPFDPFAAPAVRATQIERWREWVSAQPLRIDPEAAESR